MHVSRPGHHSLAAALLCALTLTLPMTASAKTRVVATLGDLAAIAKAVAGDAADVQVLAPATVDPHYVDPRPSFILPLSRADLLVANGLELEDAWLNRLLTGARNGSIQPGGPGYLACSAFAQLRQVPRIRVTRSMGDIHGGGNPHFTFDPREGLRCARAIADRLAALDPGNGATYRANVASFGKAVDAFVAKTRERFGALSAERRRVVSFHMSLTYLFNLLGLVDVINIEPRPGIPPSPSHTRKVLMTMKDQGVRTIVQEDWYMTGPSKTLARLGKAKVVRIPGQTRFAKGESYLQHIAAVVDAIYAGVSK